MRQTANIPQKPHNLPTAMSFFPLKLEIFRENYVKHSGPWNHPPATPPCARARRDACTHRTSELRSPLDGVFEGEFRPRRSGRSAMQPGYRNRVSGSCLELRWEQFRAVENFSRGDGRAKAGKGRCLPLRRGGSGPPWRRLTGGSRPAHSDAETRVPSLALSTPTGQTQRAQ